MSFHTEISGEFSGNFSGRQQIAGPTVLPCLGTEELQPSEITCDCSGSKKLSAAAAAAMEERSCHMLAGNTSHTMLDLELGTIFCFLSSHM